jgi:hypothetical protein
MNKVNIPEKLNLPNDYWNPGIAAVLKCRQIMKRVFILSVVINLNIILLAQPFSGASAGFRIIKLKYYNSNGEKAWTYFRYDRDNRIHKAY